MCTRIKMHFAHLYDVYVHIHADTHMYPCDIPHKHASMMNAMCVSYLCELVACGRSGKSAGRHASLTNVGHPGDVACHSEPAVPRLYWPRRCKIAFSSLSLLTWEWVKPPGYGPQILVHVSIYQGKPFSIFGSHSHLSLGSTSFQCLGDAP